MTTTLPDELTGLGLGPDPATALTSLVGAQIGDPRARLLTVDARPHPYDRPAITTASRHLVEGTAADRHGRARQFAFFVKVVRAWHTSPLAAAAPEPRRSQVAPLVPWRTEPDVYRGDLHRHLPDGLRLARAYRVVDLGPDSTAIWLDRVAASTAEWDRPSYRRAARLPGRLAADPDVARFSVDVPVARTPRGFAEGWPAYNVLPDLRSDRVWARPNVAATFDADLRHRLVGAADRLPGLLDELEALPTTTAHGDACTDNLLRADDGDVVLIDFGFWGTAPIGFDLGRLLLGDLHLGHTTGPLAQLHHATLHAYVQGLRDAGCTVRKQQVERAQALVMTVFHALTALPYEHRGIEDLPDLRPLYAARAATARFVLDLLDATGTITTAARPATPPAR